MRRSMHSKRNQVGGGGYGPGSGDVVRSLSIEVVMVNHGLTRITRILWAVLCGLAAIWLVPNGDCGVTRR
jgi:hypothetical protein